MAKDNKGKKKDAPKQKGGIKKDIPVAESPSSCE